MFTLLKRKNKSEANKLKIITQPGLPAPSLKMLMIREEREVVLVIFKKSILADFSQ